MIAALAFAGICASFMQTLVIPIQGELPQLLHASRDDTAWVVTITLLVSAIGTPIAGRMGDMFGKRRVVLILLGLLIAGSVVAALSSSVLIIILGRGLQGAGIGVIPLGISILRDVLPAAHLGSAIAFVSATLGVGGAIGLPVSALVAENADWHLLFWIAGAVGVVAYLLVRLLVPPSTVRSGGRIDVPGIIGLAIGLTALLLAVSRANEWGWGSPLTLTLLAGGVLVLLGWGWLQLRTRNPLVDLRVTARPPVLFTNLASIGIGFALFASNVAFPQLLELPAYAGGFGLPLLHAALAIMPSGFAMLAMSPIAGWFERRHGPKPLLVIAAILLAIAYLLAAILPLQVWHIVALNVLLGIGVGLGFAAMPTLIMQSVPVEESGAANGLNTLMRSFGIAAASAIVAAVLTQSAVSTGGEMLPTLDGFRMAFALALGASVVCAVFAALIPRVTPHDGEEEVLPGERL